MIRFSPSRYLSLFGIAGSHLTILGFFLPLTNTNNELYHSINQTPQQEVTSLWSMLTHTYISHYTLDYFKALYLFYIFFTFIPLIAFLISFLGRKNVPMLTTSVLWSFLIVLVMFLPTLLLLFFTWVRSGGLDQITLPIGPGYLLTLAGFIIIIFMGIRLLSLPNNAF